MININRSPNVPMALNTVEIKEYIALSSKYLSDSQNIDKPNKPTSYRTSDLLDAFDRDFFSKCYLTEQAFVNSYVMDIEHFVGQTERPDLIYDWKNLFPAEHLANMNKPRRNPAGGYLNPCETSDNVETEIIYTLSTMGTEPMFEPSNLNNVKAVNTCNLLNRIHNGHDDYSIKSTASLRHAIQKKYCEILNKIVEWQVALNEQDKHQHKRELKSLLSRKSSFTMLCRSMPAVRKALDDSFFD